MQLKEIKTNMYNKLNQIFDNIPDSNNIDDLKNIFTCQAEWYGPFPTMRGRPK